MAREYAGEGREDLFTTFKNEMLKGTKSVILTQPAAFLRGFYLSGFGLAGLRLF